MNFCDRCATVDRASTIVALVLLGIAAVVIFLWLFIYEPRDSDNFAEMYRYLRERVAVLGQASPDVAEVSELYEQWLDAISRRPAWRRIGAAALGVAIVAGGLVLARVPFAWVAVFVFAVAFTLFTMTHSWFTWHVIRPEALYNPRAALGP